MGNNFERRGTFFLRPREIYAIKTSATHGNKLDAQIGKLVDHLSRKIIVNKGTHSLKSRR